MTALRAEQRPPGRPRPALSRLYERLHRLAATPRDQATCLFFTCLIVYVVTASYTWQSSDTASMFYPAWQFAQHGNITMDAFADEPLWWHDTGDRTVSNRFPGAMWLAVPFYLLDRSAAPSAVMGNLAAATATAGAVTIFFLLGRRLAPTRTAAAAALILAFATPTWAVSGDALWTHGPGQLWLLLGVLLSLRGAPFSAGLAFGAAVLTRPHYGVVSVVTGLWDAARHRRLRPMILIAAGTAVGTAALVLYNHQVFGATDVRSGYQSPNYTLGAAASRATSSTYLDNIAGLILSPSRGVLIITPFLLVLLPGLRSAWRQAPDWARSAALAGTAYMAVQSVVNGFSGGYAFYGYRLPIEWLTLCSPLLLLSYQHWTRLRAWRRRTFAVLVLYSLATGAAAAVAFTPELQEPEHWSTWATAELFTQRPVAATTAAGAALLLAVTGWMAARRPPVDGAPVEAVTTS